VTGSICIPHCYLELVISHKVVTFCLTISTANINDRSLQGNKDSEVSVIIEDVDMVSWCKKLANGINFSEFNFCPFKDV